MGSLGKEPTSPWSPFESETVEASVSYSSDPSISSEWSSVNVWKSLVRTCLSLFTINRNAKTKFSCVWLFERDILF